MHPATGHLISSALYNTVASEANWKSGAKLMKNLDKQKKSYRYCLRLNLQKMFWEGVAKPPPSPPPPVPTSMDFEYTFLVLIVD